MPAPAPGEISAPEWWAGVPQTWGRGAIDRVIKTPSCEQLRILPLMLCADQHFPLSAQR